MPTKILIVDDSATIRLQVGRALTAAGFSTVDAANGALGLTALAQNADTKLVVCDVNMPTMDGIEFLESITETHRHIPVVMLTTEGQPELIERAKALGAKGWILKPFKAELLLAAVRKLTTASQAGG